MAEKGQQQEHEAAGWSASLFHNRGVDADGAWLASGLSASLFRNRDVNADGVRARAARFLLLVQPVEQSCTQ